jgi:hypothetical protein
MIQNRPSFGEFPRWKCRPAPGRARSLLEQTEVQRWQVPAAKASNPKMYKMDSHQSALFAWWLERQLPSGSESGKLGGTSVATFMHRDPLFMEY